ncbi:MAG: hypothetical protein ACRCR4_01695 [Thiotrichaceae bacterium]
MQSANDIRNLKHYLFHCLFALVPTYVLASLIWRLDDSPSILAHYGNFYTVTHAIFTFIALVLFRKLLVRWCWWKIALLGMFVGVLATCLALPVSTVIALDDGTSRLANAYPLVGWIQAFAIYCVFSFYTYAWLLGASIFITVKWSVGRFIK